MGNKVNLLHFSYPGLDMTYRKKYKEKKGPKFYWNDRQKMLANTKQCFIKIAASTHQGIW